jgi:RNA polymerase sigma factor (sigma-70 family)
MISNSVRLTISRTPDEQYSAATNRISSGDDDARFKRVVLPHLGDAYSLARWITGNRADAEDVVQDACLRAFRGIGNFSNSNARAWVLTIVRNTAYTWLRKNRPSAVLVVEDLEEIETAQVNRDSETPETTLIAKANAHDLRTAMAALQTPYREALILRDVQGLSYREIAEVTGVRTGTVMSRLARARRRLIAIWQRTRHDGFDAEPGWLLAGMSDQGRAQNPSCGSVRPR